MPTCRDIPEEKWAHATSALIQFFAHRYKCEDAADLAQDTLKAIWSRPDYEFKNEDDLMRVLHAFAKNVLLASRRRSGKRIVASADAEYAPSPDHNAFGMTSVEMAIFFDQATRQAEAELPERDLKVFRKRNDEDKEAAAKELGMRGRGHFAVALHRVMKKLAKIVGGDTRET